MSTDPLSSTTPAAAPTPGAPVLFGAYQLVRQLGGGGMGIVYDAFHPHLRRRVAVKTLKPGRAGDPKFAARFRREMAAIGNLDHPNLVRATDAGEANGVPFLVMDFVEGMDLHHLVRQVGRLAIADACEIARQTALGLQYIHEHGMVHRDIKPSNLMLTPEGTLKILDLGLALFQPEHPAHETLSDTGQYMGTGDFMAPEQAVDSHRVDIRADLYSLGCTLYKLLTGQPPFPGPEYDTAGKKLLAHATVPPPALQSKRPDIPDQLAELVDQLLKKDPSQRPARPDMVERRLAGLASACDLRRLAMRVQFGSEDVPKDMIAEVLATKSFVTPLDRMAPSSSSATQPSGQETTVMTAPASGRRWWVAMLALGIAAVLALCVWISWPPPSANHDNNGGKQRPISADGAKDDPAKDKGHAKKIAEFLWPSDYPPDAKDLVPERALELLGPKTELRTKDHWQYARGPVTPIPTKEKPLVDLLWGRRVFGNGYYYPNAQEITLWSGGPPDLNGTTFLAIFDHQHEFAWEWHTEITSRSFPMHGPESALGLFWGWQEHRGGARALLLELKAPAVPKGPAKISARVGEAMIPPLKNDRMELTALPNEAKVADVFVREGFVGILKLRVTTGRIEAWYDDRLLFQRQVAALRKGPLGFWLHRHTGHFQKSEFIPIKAEMR